MLTFESVEREREPLLNNLNCCKCGKQDENGEEHLQRDVKCTNCGPFEKER